MLESALDELPDIYRQTFVLREVEGLDTAQTADVLSVSEDVVKTRLHRAKGLLRESLYARVGGRAAGAFPFPARRCDRVVAAVMTALQGGIDRRP